ncbi:C40 family peptidase [Actinomadura sp. NAK00032]|uniref:C40 family peptidase n=1 Tax=Actinomadura sp. NAK00032 TaxID=2742128 RepID=UPI001591BB47|nr:lytic transglycosylase domain-containing protein [Actinomadura sp. NAK00032]QKW33530.1 C40 family peptidase [Actinomadura sp. NAK00032]
MRKNRMIWLIIFLPGGSISLLLVMALLAAVIFMMMTPSVSNVLQACAPNTGNGGSGVVQANASRDSIPQNYLALYQKTGREQNIPWNVLAGIGKIESDHGRSTLPGVHSSENYAGAGGPMQFLQSSWLVDGADGDGDGVEDRYNPADAILGASNHLRRTVGKKSPSIPLSSNDITRAVHLYNPGNYTPATNPYVKSVMAAANRYAKEYHVAPVNLAQQISCSGGAFLGSGSFGQLTANAAAYWARKDPGTPQPPSQNSVATPYSWGGGTIKGPSRGTAQGANTVGFDCSSLAQFAVYKASKGRITIPRTTYAIWASKLGTKVSRAQLAPGDLVFFNNQQHMGIYYGEVNGVRWMVHAPRTGDYVKFSKFDGRSDYDGAVRITAPGPPKVIRAMAPTGVRSAAGAM